MGTTPFGTPDTDDAEIGEVLGDLVTRSLKASATDPKTRSQLIDLLSFPTLPIDRSAYSWVDVGPGLKLHLVSEDPSRGMKRCLVWGAPGAATHRHNHTGDEVILVLEGHLKDERGTYGPGDICRSAAGDIHQEQVLGDTDCVCFVVYYGDLIPV